jgi:hypothetical protein
MSFDVEEIRARVDLRALAEEAGAEFRGDSSRCPLHGGNNPSAFHLYEGGRKWHCFTRCQDGQNDGDVIAFYMAWKRVDFVTACRELSERVGVVETSNVKRQTSNVRVYEDPPEAPVGAWQARARAWVRWSQEQLWGPAGVGALGYLREERGLSDLTIRAFGLGYSPRDMYEEAVAWGLEEDGRRVWMPRGIVIPGMDGEEVWYVKVRRPLPGDSLAARIGAVERLPEVKFSGPRGGRMVLFGADKARGLPVALLCEGEWDAMLAWQEADGLCDVLSLGGAKQKADVLDLVQLARYTAVIAVYDADAAGDAGREYLSGVPRVVPVRPPDHDLTDFWRGGGNLRGWIAGLVAEQLAVAMIRMERQPEGWMRIYDLASVTA